MGQRRFSAVSRFAINIKLRRRTSRQSAEIGNCKIKIFQNSANSETLRRKSNLVTSSHGDTRSTAIIYSLVVTAKLHNVEPFAYLKGLLTRLPRSSPPQACEATPAKLIGAMHKAINHAFNWTVHRFGYGFTEEIQSRAEKYWTHAEKCGSHSCAICQSAKECFLGLYFVSLSLISIL